MQRSVRPLTALAVSVVCTVGAASCDSMSVLGGNGQLPNGVAGQGPGAAADGGSGGTDDGGGGGDDGASQADGGVSCQYTDDKSFCACMGWNCGGTTVPDTSGTNRSVYCGSCPNTAYCMYDSTLGPGVGTCGGKNPLAYAFQKEKIDMLVSMGENDNTTINYGFAKNIGDGRGYTVGKVGFCTGTGDFIIVAACYNDAKPGNILAKYWGHRDASGTATDGLIYYNDQFVATGQNQGDTKLIDKLGGFVADVATAAGDAAFRACQDAVADAFDLAPAAKHVNERGFSGALTIGFLYDTELNFGDDDDTGDPDAGVPPTAGTKTVMARADADYGDAGLPTDFSGNPWEESKWLGYLIKERAIVMAGNPTWKTDIDQNATWEAARRLHTGKTSTPETGTSLDMDYDLTSEYKAGSTIAGTPCWPTGLPSALDSASSIYVISTDKSASSTDETKWTATGTLNSSGAFAACPANPTP